MKGTSDGSSGDSKILSIFKPSKRSSKVGGKSGLPKEPDIIKSKNFVKAIQIFKQAHPASTFFFFFLFFFVCVCVVTLSSIQCLPRMQGTNHWALSASSCVIWRKSSCPEMSTWT